MHCLNEELVVDEEGLECGEVEHGGKWQGTCSSVDCCGEMERQRPRG